MQHARLLSRSKNLSKEYVAKAKHALRDVNYNYELWWGWQDNESCEYSYERTDDEAFNDLLMQEPNWSQYGSSRPNTLQFKNLFGDITNMVPYGQLNQLMYFKGVSLYTPIRRLIQQSNF